jgi:putative ABC transport system substrate-binding protein
MPVIGILEGGSADAFGPAATAYRKGLADAGFLEGRNVRIETRWAEGHYDRLPPAG